jgi:hypothetical protein
MIPLKAGAPGLYVRVTQHFRRRKERMIESKGVIDLEDVTNSTTESISPTKVEDKTLTVSQVEMGQRSENPNGSANPNPEKPVEPERMKGQQQRHDAKEVLVEDTTSQPYTKGEEEEMTETMEEGHPAIG